MKEHITPKQAKEITEEQFHVLFSNQYWSSYRRKDWANYHHKKVTVGKMIEVLHENRDDYTHAWVDIEYDQKEWHVTIEKDSSAITFSEYELCDALWNAVVSTLLES